MNWTERELREQTAWMRRVARALTGDADQAEDLTQDAWVATLDGRAKVHSPRAWFRKVLQNRKVSDQRSRGRRADRERIAAKPESIPAVDDAAQRVELQAKLAKAVFSLEEPYRQVITLRYLQGWPPRRIAADLNLQKRQVEVRLRQGLERLRTKLDAECDGRREEWFGGLLALGTSGTPLWKTGALVGAALLTIGSGIYLPSLRRSEPVEITAEVAALIARPAEVVDGLASAENHDRELIVPAQDARDLTAGDRRIYQVTLVRAGDDEALAGAAVTIGMETLSADEEGILRFDQPADRRLPALQVAATATTRKAKFELSEPGDHLFRVPRRGGTLHGKVLTLSGEPLPHAEVRFFSKPGSGGSVSWMNPVHNTRADGHGAFEIHDLAGSAGGARSYRVLAAAPGHLSVYVLDGRIRPGEKDFAVLITEPARLVSGRVSSWDKASVAEAPILAYSKNNESLAQAKDLLRDQAKSGSKPWGTPRRYPTFSLESKADGTFEFYRTAEACHLQVDHPEYTGWRAWIPENEFIDVVLDSGCTVLGRIFDAKGEPIQGAKVLLQSQEKREPVTTNAEGEFRFSALTQVEGALLTVLAKEHACGIFVIDVVPAGPPHEVRLEKERIVRGRLVDASGNALANERVELRGDRIIGSAWFPRYRGLTWEEWAHPALWQCQTDAEGEFEFRGLYPGSFRIRTEDDTWCVVPKDGEKFVVVQGVHTGSTNLRGAIRLESDAAVESITVTATRYIEGETQPTPTRVVRDFSSGEFEIPALDPGIWKIEVFHPESQLSWSSEPEFLGPGEHLFDAVLGPTKTGPNRR